MGCYTTTTLTHAIIKIYFQTNLVLKQLQQHTACTINQYMEFTIHKELQYMCTH